VEEFWRYRRLLSFFAARAAEKLYKGTTLGRFWLFARPLLPLIIGTLIFGNLLKVPSDGVPYFLFYLTGQGLWHFFERGLLWGTRSLDRQKGLMKKMYFPRLIVPIASVVPAFIDLAIYLVIFLAACVYYYRKDGVWYFAVGRGLPASLLAVVVCFGLVVSLSLFTCVWQLRHREVRFTMRYFMRFWSYLTPIIYPMSQVPPKLRWAIYLNPMASVIETFKWGLLGVGEFALVPLLCSLAIVPVLLALGVWYFTHSEAASVDDM
jgi:lipopolysaccharide transport system permease protein